MISRRQKMVNLWKQVRFIEIVDPGNQFVKNLMFDGVYSSDFALLSEPILEMKQLESKEQQEEYQKVVRQLFQLEE